MPEDTAPTTGIQASDEGLTAAQQVAVAAAALNDAMLRAAMHGVRTDVNIIPAHETRGMPLYRLAVGMWVGP